VALSAFGFVIQSRRRQGRKAGLSVRERHRGYWTRICRSVDRWEQPEWPNRRGLGVLGFGRLFGPFSTFAGSRRGKQNLTCNCSCSLVFVFFPTGISQVLRCPHSQPIACNCPVKTHIQRT
jgi:hypothetical protein